MRIAIIGTGISGLSLYLWLAKLHLTETHGITVYERRPQHISQDGEDDDDDDDDGSADPLGLTPNGLRVLRSLDEQSLFAEVMRTSNRVRSCRIPSARGWRPEDVGTTGGALGGRRRRNRRKPRSTRFWTTFATPPLPTWERQGCPGAGNAETLARLLAHHLARDTKSGHLLAWKQYSDLRMPRLARVHKKAQGLGGMKQDMGVLQETMMYLIVWAMAYFGWGKSYDEYLFGYSV
ncbi:hypothetical protein B0A55_12018 [Friedmanniomyces simplex]|uniref:Uncharacterized protein n=1 Tax=Friedmanniomyces simplex TaxID=329884 RepID=A0A4U0WLK8_9PEZI|nr:hypothetical protein B0A55_12018 [Friedmanniomyces simplex]